MNSCKVGKFSVQLLLLSSLFLASAKKPCMHRKYDEDSSVCVCNATYCDTVEAVRLPEVGKFISYTSSRDGLRFANSEGNFMAQAQLNQTDIKANVDARETQQKIYGWGGAFTDAAGINIRSLNKNARRHLLRSYFSKNGIEYSLCRVTIGSTDFSTRHYSYAAVPHDTNLTHFKLAIEDYKYKIPLIKRALRMSGNRLQLFASAWDAPAWMKTSAKPSNVAFLKKEYYQTWTDYHVKFLEAYGRLGINFWGITTGNEATLALIPILNIHTLGWMPWDQGTWIEQSFGPTIRKSKFKDIKIIAVDDQTPLSLVWLVLETLFNKAEMFIDGIGIHWYFNRVFTSPMRLLRLVFPDKFILGTEACSGDLRYAKRVALGSWERGEAYADDIIQDMEDWTSGWTEWNLAVDTSGGPTVANNFVDGTIVVNATAQEFYKQPTFYYLGHFSKFVPPSSVRVSSNITTDLVKIVAFLRPDNGTALVVHNKQNHSVPITIHDARRGYIDFTAEKRSISTIVYL